MRAALLLLIAVAPGLAAQGAPTPPPAAAQLFTAVQPETVTVGQPFRSVVRLTVAPGARAGYSPLPVRDEVQPIDSVQILPSDADASTATAVYTLVAWTTDPIEATVPVRVTVPGAEARVYQVRLRLPVVRSVLPPGEEEIAPRAARGVLGGASSRLPAWLWWALAVAAAGLAALLARRLRGPAPAESLDPRARALARLEALAGEATGSPEASRGVYVGGAAALREYLAALSPAWGVELTTTELLERLTEGGAPAAARDGLARLLRAADRVKFAGQTPDADSSRGFPAAARDWVLGYPPAGAGEREAA